MGEPEAGECITHALPIDGRMSIAWALDLQRMWEALLELLAELVEGGVAAAELPMEEEEEEQQRRGPSAGGAVPLQAPGLV